MACNAPLVAWKSTETTALGKRAVTFDVRQAHIDLPLNLPCGKCHGCLLDKSRQWALRCSHEAQLHEENTFVTLTYDEKNLPRTANGTPTLRPEDFVLFMKRLRRQTTQKISFFHCGEYGEKDNRPHHHALLFNRGFGDMYYWRKERDYRLYRSPELEKLWPYGHSEIGEVNFATAGYIARYQIKNQKETAGVIKPYLTMSRRPGIGKDWIKKYITDVYPSDQCVTIGGHIYRPPRYYDQHLERQNPEMLQHIQATRIAKLTNEQKSGLRSTAREAILRAKSHLRRKQL